MFFFLFRLSILSRAIWRTSAHQPAQRIIIIIINIIIIEPRTMQKKR